MRRHGRTQKRVAEQLLFWVLPWRRFCEIKAKPCKGLKTQNGVAILCFGIKCDREVA